MIGLGAALLAAGRARSAGRPAAADPLAATLAGAALAGFAYWFVHGSFDWFWEFAGLGAPAFALLGLACSLGSRAPARASATDASPGAARERGIGDDQAADARSAPRALRPLGLGLASILTLAAIASLLLPWLSQLRVQSAVRVWPTAPRLAYEDLNKAAGPEPAQLTNRTHWPAASPCASATSRAPNASSPWRWGATRATPTRRSSCGAIASARGHRREAAHAAAASSSA